jgi:amino acid transporter
LGGFVTLFAVFAIAWLTTRVGYARKRQLGLAESRRGRNAGQVLANVAAAAIFAIFAMLAIFYRGFEFAAVTALAEAASRFLGNFGRTLMLVGLAVSAFGWTASDILSSPRILYAFGRDAFLPKWFAQIHPRFHTPHIAIVAYATAAFLLSFSSTFQKLAVLSNMAVLLLYILCCLAALELNRRDVRTDGVPFKLPAGNLVPIVAIIFIIWVLAHGQKDEFEITALCLVVASLLFLIREYLRSRKAKPA